MPLDIEADLGVLLSPRSLDHTARAGRAARLSTVDNPVGLRMNVGF